jgi:hypothetical protein
MRRAEGSSSGQNALRLGMWMCSTCGLLRATSRRSQNGNIGLMGAKAT